MYSNECEMITRCSSMLHIYMFIHKPLHTWMFYSIDYTTDYAILFSSISSNIFLNFSYLSFYKAIFDAFLAIFGVVGAVEEVQLCFYLAIPLLLLFMFRRFYLLIKLFDAANLPIEDLVLLIFSGFS